jgi:hypothetical protein
VELMKGIVVVVVVVGDVAENSPKKRFKGERRK